MSLYKYPIPGGSWQSINIAPGLPQNPGLLFDRFLCFSEEWKNNKSENFKLVKGASEKIDTNLLNANYLRWEAMLKAQKGICFKMQTDWRFITGLGRKGSLEVGFTFNRYGFPILPGSSVKGLARASALLIIAESLKIEKLGKLETILEEPDLNKFDSGWKNYPSNPQIDGAAKLFRDVFGTQGQAGIVNFFDAIPDKDKKPNLVIDIMTPHFSQYYQQDGKYPTDNQSPVPIQFLAVEKTCFWFGLSCQYPEDEYQKAALSITQRWLQYGLRKLGAGAKTNAGYGFFILNKQENL